jgi:hypothetical protein
MLSSLAVLSIPPAGCVGSQQWALLIGVQKHTNPAYNVGVQYVLRDVATLRKTLVERGGMLPGNILVMTEESQPKHQPRLANLRREIPSFLRLAAEGDSVIVYFAGHGTLISGRTYLVPRDFDNRQAKVTGLPMDELRQALIECKATIKYVILDCCHAGSNRDIKDRKVPGSEVFARDLNLPRVPSCTVLASCRADEGSQEWPERQQGIFTYWLCRALEGGATEGNGTVSVASVNRYVHERVIKTALKLGIEQQTPVMYGELPGDPPLLWLKPEAPASLARRLAEHLDLDLREQRLKKVGVLAFNFMPLREGPSLPAGVAMPMVCADLFVQSLQKLPDRSYEVVGPRDMSAISRGLMVGQRLQPRGKEMVRDLTNSDGVIMVVIRPRQDQYSVQYELIPLAGTDVLCRAGGMVTLRLQQQEELVQQALEILGCKLTLSENLAGQAVVVEVHFPNDAGEEAIIEATRMLPALRTLRALDLGSTKVGGRALSGLGRLPHLVELTLSDTLVGDKDLKYVATLNKLATLDLSATRVTDIGLKQIAQLGTLRRVILAHTRVTDTGVKELLTLSNLEYVDLSDTQINGTTLEQLASLRHLQTVMVAGTAIPENVIKKLKSIAPLVKVVQ